GATWVAARLESALAGKLALGRVAGTLSGPFTLTAVRYHDPQTGLDACIQRLTVKVVLPALLSRQVRVSSIEVEGALVALPERSKPSKPQRPFSLTPPIDIVLDRFELRGARVTQRGRTLLTIDQARLAASWTHAGLAVRQFWVNSRDGAARFAGTVSVQHSPDSADSHSTTLDGADSTTHQSTPRYLGYGSGSMRWSVASLTYAGT